MKNVKSNKMESEKLAYDYMLQHATELNDKTAVRDLQKIDKNAFNFPNQKYLMTVRTSLMNKYGIGFAHEKIISTIDMAIIILLFKGYTLPEKINYVKGMMFSQATIWNDVIEDNFFESSATFQIPVHITHGKYDYQVSYTLAREWFDKIEAPQKSFFTLENSAHGVIMEEPENFVQIIRNIAMKQEK